jgi:riboflavin synthase
VFTGLVTELGTVSSVERSGEGVRLRIEAGCAAELAEGDSVMVNGVCLTAVGPRAGEFGADLSPETVDRSCLGDLAAGDRVNLELSLRPTDRLGGHIVQGHVDGVATVSRAEPDGLARSVRFDAPTGLLRYVVEKGSIAVNGVSLTVTEVDGDGFSVSLIPETLARTNLTHADAGTRVNLEVDVIAKYVEKLARG